MFSYRVSVTVLALQPENLSDKQHAFKSYKPSALECHRLKRKGIQQRKKGDIMSTSSHL